MKTFLDLKDEPPIGTRFIALHWDGSVACLYLRIGDDEYLDAQKDTYDYDFFADCGYLYWIPLPDDFKLCFEQQEVEENQ